MGGATTVPEAKDGDEALARELESSARLVQAVLQEAPSLTAIELAQETGVDLDVARRLWRALGFPEYGAEVAFTGADAEAVRTMSGLVAGDIIDLDVAVQITRAVGQTMSRLADWEVATLLARVHDLAESAEATGSRTEAGVNLIEALTPAFDRMLVYAWRRHLAAAVARANAMVAGELGGDSTLVTVGFADIVAFTALSNEIGRHRIGDIVEAFEARCADVVAAHHGRVIKSIGDSVLFVNTEATRAIDTALGIVSVIGRDPRMPDVRLGLATGPVVTRMGDVFGPPVNLAARLTQVARRNRIVTDTDTARRLPDDEFEARWLPARPLRGFGDVEPVAVRRR